MQVILTQDVADVGLAGDLVQVKPGFGANFLIPTGQAVLATSGNKRRLDHERRRIEAQLARDARDAQELAKRVDGLSVTLTRLVGEDDKIFGSVTAKDICDALADEGLTVDRRAVQLESPLRALGVYEVPIRLHRGVLAQVKVWVVAD